MRLTDADSAGLSRWRRRGFSRLLAASLLGIAGSLALPGAEVSRNEPSRPETSPASPVSRIGARTSYKIDVKLDPPRRELAGAEIIHFVNTSQVPVSSLRFHLYWNAFENAGSTFLREAPELVEKLGKNDGWGWCDIEDATLVESGIRLPVSYLHGPDAAPGDRTVAEVKLPGEIGPGQSADVRVVFTNRFPKGTPRCGVRGRFHAAAQWYPQLAVLGAREWTSRTFHRSTEFFADFADYDVSIDVPEEQIVAASGVPVDKEVRSWNGRKVARFKAENVHDFAWFSDPGFLVRNVHQSRGEGLPPMEIELFIQPEHDSQSGRYLSALQSAVQAFEKKLGAYPYPRLTAVDPRYLSEAGGMEYPTIISLGTTVDAPRGANHPETVTFHEFGHQYFYGLLANDETEEAWLDEGINTYLTGRLLREAYGPDHFRFELFGRTIAVRPLAIDYPEETSAPYFDEALSDPGSSPSYAFRNHASYRANSYHKTALALATVERHFGQAAMDKTLRAFVENFRYQHPKGTDFLDTLERNAGLPARNLFETIRGGDGIVDYAVTKCEASPSRKASGWEGEAGSRRTLLASRPSGFDSVVEVSRLGGISLPVEIEMVFADGTKIRRIWDGRDRWIRYTSEGASPIEHAHVDPDRKILVDVDQINNGRNARPHRRSAWCWSERLVLWIESAAELFSVLG